jgi:hypothetical protein
MSEEQDVRWQQIIDARVDFGDGVSDHDVVPLRATERGGSTRRADRKAAQFNEALSSFSSWSSVERPRRRMSA